MPDGLIIDVVIVFSNDLAIKGSVMADAFILSAVRTPIGKYLGAFAEVPAPELGAVVLAQALRRGQAAGKMVDEVIVGNVLQAGLGQNPARQAALKAGLPDTIAAVTINKVCGSGLKAVMLAAQAIRAGDAELILAGGMENMSRAPFLLFGARSGWKYGDQKAVDAMIHDGLWCAFENWHMGEAAEHIAAKCHVSRTEQDRFAAQSQRRAAAAWEQGWFEKEIAPVTVGTGAKARTVSRDESVRPETTAENLAKLKPSFSEGGTVTAGNASTLSDGAAAVLVGSCRPRRDSERSRWRGSSPTPPAASRRRTSSSHRSWRCDRSSTRHDWR